MPNKTMNFEVDVLPATDATYNLGNSQKKWVINGYNISDASAKGVDTSISVGSTSTNLPTSQAVASYVAEHGTNYETVTSQDIDEICV